jgi:hypothetical protein
MKAILALFAGCALLVVVMTVVAITAVAQALPLLITAFVAALALRSRRTPPRPVTRPALRAISLPPQRQPQLSGEPTTVLGPSPPSLSGGWVFLPIWVPPARRPSPPRIDTVFLREDRHGRQW